MAEDNPNTDAGLSVAFDYTKANPGDIVSDGTLSEIVRRLVGMVQLASSSGGTIVSQTAPVDTSLVWYLSDENNIPTGQSFTYNQLTNQWESTDQSLPLCYQACIDGRTTNLLIVTSDGELLLDQSVIDGLIASKQQAISSDSGNLIGIGEDGGIYGDPKRVGVSGDANNALSLGTDLLAYLASTQLGISADSDNKLTLGGDSLPSYVPAVSANANNDLTIGSDGLPYYNEPVAGVGGGISGDADNDLEEGTDGKPYLSFDDAISVDAGNELAIGTDDLFLVEAKHHASLTVEDNATTTAFGASSTNFSNRVQVLTFNGNGDSRGAVPDHTNDHITIAKTGTYLIQGAFTITGAAGEVYSMAVFVNNGATQKGVRGTKEMNAAGDNDGSVSLSVLVDLTIGDTVELWAQNETGTGAMVMQDGALSVIQID